MSFPGTNAAWLAAYLTSLRGEQPVDESRLKEFGMPFAVRTSGVDDGRAFLALLEARIDDLSIRDAAIARAHLFGKGNVSQRSRAVQKDLREETFRGGSESTFRNFRKSALVELAQRVAPALELAGNVSDKASRLDPHRPWYEVIAIDWELRLDPSDYRLQHWRIRETVRSIRSEQPLVFIVAAWSGTGGHLRDPDGEEIGPVVTSGPRRGRFKHAFLRHRPSGTQPVSDEIYIFDLGAHVEVGSTETLEFTMTLFDEGDTFESHLLWRTYGHPALQELTATFAPGRFAPRWVSAHRERLGHPVNRFRSPFEPVVPAIPVNRDPDGGYRVRFTEFGTDGEEHCELRWDGDYQQSTVYND